MSCYLRTWPTLNLWAPVAPWPTRWLSTYGAYRVHTRSLFIFHFFHFFSEKKLVRLQIYLLKPNKVCVGHMQRPPAIESASPTSERQPTVRVATPPPCAKKRIHSQPAHMHAWLVTYMRACMRALMIVGLSHQSTDVGQKFTAPFHNPIVHNLLSHPRLQGRPLSRDSKISAQRKEPLLLTRRSSERGL